MITSAPRKTTRAKTVLTDTGPVDISVSRDRDASFEPAIVTKRQRLWFTSLRRFDLVRKGET
jgi:transposase-like protein